MARKRPSPKRNRPADAAEAEYRFTIDVYTPATIPQARLAQYLKELADMYGEKSAVHFHRLEKSSLVVVSKIEREAAPKVRERTNALRRGDGTKDAVAAYRNINALLRSDNAVGTLRDKENISAVILRFPGREQAVEEFTAVKQHGSIDGIITGIRGKDESVHITLQIEGQQISGISTTNRSLAKQLANKYWEPVRLFGRGKWNRDAEGNWTLQDFKIEHFEALSDMPLSSAIAEIRTIQASWDDDSFDELGTLRTGPGGKRNGGH
jgi:hypothetical protein